MYVIKNITSQEISIPELRVTLSPDEKIDLDMVSSRFYIDQSSLLRSLFRANKLKCIIKDNGQGALEIATKERVAPQQASPIPNKDQHDVLDAVKKLEDKIYKKLDEKVQNSQPVIDVNALNQVLQSLQTIVNNTTNSQVAAPQVNQKESDNIDHNKMIDIQKRTVNRLVNKAESHVKHDEQTTDKDVSKNIKELEGLL